MLTEKIAKAIGPDQIELAYAHWGNPDHPPLILIMGISAQMIHWPQGFLDALIEKGLSLVCFDNRDSGHSSHMVHAPTPDFQGAMQGDFSSVSYTLSQMAADTIGLMDHLGIQHGHLVGASMGGAIAQTIALEYPERILSLTSMMSTTGQAGVGQVHPETMRSVFGGPPVNTREEAIQRALRTSALVGSPRYPSSEEELSRVAGLAWDRDHDVVAVTRQAIASLASGDRSEKLKQLTVPTLVIHGLADTLCDPSGGRATSEAIPGAQLLLLDGMGHNLPKAVWPTLAQHISALVFAAEQRRT
jgi:pimeloyl-ACP methyl ester carboxylesterase